MRAALAPAVAATMLATGIVRAEAVDPAIEASLSGVVASLDPRASSAIAGIEGTGRRLLAARAYLRAGTGLGVRWSWTIAEAAAFEDTAGKRSLDEAVARVRCAFESRNPGYTIWVNPAFRSLDLQLERWNANPAIGLAGDHLAAAVRHAFVLSAGGTPEAVAALRELLLAHVPEPTPPLAAPGLSPHGQLRAVDFQVESAGRIVAGTETASIATEWIADGWKARLREAVTAAGGDFQGPLSSPDEPWHYEFRPPSGPGERVALAGCPAA